MPRFTDFVRGPWRAVPALGVTQILGWGSLIYPPVLIVPLIAAERGWSLSFAMSGLSVALFCAGMAAPLVGRQIDLHGGHVVMAVGSLVAALGLVAIVYAESPAAYFAAWMIAGIGMGASLYDAAFASLGRIFGAGARRAITLLTFPGGLASTVSWPVTHLLVTTSGWRGAYLIYAALLVAVAAPLHAFALPRRHGVAGEAPAAGTSAPVSAPASIPSLRPARGPIFILVATAFTAYAFIPSALSAHLLAIFQRAGIEAATAVAIGALFGPAQVTARLGEFMFGGGSHPLAIARVALGTTVLAFVLIAVAGISAPTAAAFSIMFGLSNGLVTIARGTVPLALFGASGYGGIVGRIAGPFLIMQSLAPMLMALVAERLSDAAALAMTAAFAVVALACFFVIRKPQ
jgi:MFS family permease